LNVETVFFREAPRSSGFREH